MAGTDDNKPTDKESAANNIEPVEEEYDENVREEYDLLDSKLDELNQALDMLEQKNDDIHKRLKDLLQSNKDIRQQLKHENSEVQQFQMD